MCVCIYSCIYVNVEEGKASCHNAMERQKKLCLLLSSPSVPPPHTQTLPSFISFFLPSSLFLHVLLFTLLPICLLNHPHPTIHFFSLPFSPLLSSLYSITHSTFPPILFFLIFSGDHHQPQPTDPAINLINLFFFLLLFFLCTFFFFFLSLSFILSFFFCTPLS